MHKISYYQICLVASEHYCVHVINMEVYNYLLIGPWPFNPMTI